MRIYTLGSHQIFAYLPDIYDWIEPASTLVGTATAIKLLVTYGQISNHPPAVTPRPSQTIKQ
jgi:hypothetical protein